MIIVPERFRKDLGDLHGLADSIQSIGLLHPIVVGKDGKLVAGQRRLEAWRLLGRSDDDIPRTVIDLDDVRLGERDENQVRKDFTPSEAVAIARAIRPLEQSAARERQLAGVPSGKFPEGTGRANEKAAAFTGRSYKTLEKAEAVVKAAEEQPLLYRPLVEKMDRTGKVDGVFLQLQRREKVTTLEATPVPQSTYRTIAIDPPWALEGQDNGWRHDAAKEYATMSTEQIGALQLPADSQCHLYLWVTNANIPNAFPLIDRWGFTYRSFITWVKPSIGPGQYFRNATEHIIFATKGAAPIRDESIPTWFEAPREKHSEKPGIFYSIAEKASYPPFIDMFGRKERENWDVWGSGNDI